MSHLIYDSISQSFYSQFGTLADCTVMIDTATGRSRGFGFVTFAKVAEVDAAMSARPHLIDAKAVEPKRAIPKEMIAANATSSTKKLYVSGIRPVHTEQTLRDYFAAFDQVEAVEIATDRLQPTKPRGFAFVTFADHDAVDKCVLIRSHMIDGHRCDVKRAVSKEAMRERGGGGRQQQQRPPTGCGGRQSAGWDGGQAQSWAGWNSNWAQPCQPQWAQQWVPAQG